MTNLVAVVWRAPLYHSVFPSHPSPFNFASCFFCQLLKSEFVCSWQHFQASVAVIQSLGNAKTTTNSNSSRMVRFKIFFWNFLSHFVISLYCSENARQKYFNVFWVVKNINQTAMYIFLSLGKPFWIPFVRWSDIKNKNPVLSSWFCKFQKCSA